MDSCCLHDIMKLFFKAWDNPLTIYFENFPHIHNLRDQDPNVKNHFWYAVTLLTIACKSTGHIYTIYCHAKIHCFPPQSWNNWVCIRSHWQNTKEVYNIPFDSAFISLQYSSVWCCLKLQYSVQNIHVQSTYNVFLMRASVTSLWWWQMTSWP